MSDPALIEVAVQALQQGEISANDEELLALVIAAVTPLIKAAALEKAAKVAEKHTNWPATVPETWAREEIAAAIRALKEQP